MPAVGLPTPVRHRETKAPFTRPGNDRDLDLTRAPVRVEPDAKAARQSVVTDEYFGAMDRPAGPMLFDPRETVTAAPVVTFPRIRPRCHATTVPRLTKP